MGTCRWLNTASVGAAALIVTVAATALPHNPTTLMPRRGDDNDAVGLTLKGAEDSSTSPSARQRLYKWKVPGPSDLTYIKSLRQLAGGERR